MKSCQMKSWKRIILSSAWSGLVVFGLGITLQAQVQQATASNSGQLDPTEKPGILGSTSTSASDGAGSDNLPDSPGTLISAGISAASDKQAQTTPDIRHDVQTYSQVQLPSSDPPQDMPRGQDQTAQAQTPQSQPPQSTNSPTPQKPVGTAAAGAPDTSGIAASQPAGVAIAPAKQHRVRTIVIKTGAIIAAGAAIGTVVALTAATPSRPPGAH
jgi:hypothetical protein